MPRYRIYQGDVLERLRDFASECVHCVITSPPYWGLRDYGADGQLGLERTPEEYVGRLVEIFREVKRVLRKDGTLWLNLGDSYGGSGKGPDDKQPGVRDYTSPPYVGNGVKAKDLVGIPWMVAFALRADGWYLRSDIIWSKPNPMPESVTDRPTKSHEYIFLLSRSQRYYFDAEAVKETATSTDSSLRDRDGTKLNNTPGRTRMGGLVSNGYHKRNVRSVWSIATQPFKDAHFATFPQKLVDRCVRAASSQEGVCGQCGAPYTRVIEKAAGLPRDRDELRNCPPGTGSDGRNNISGPMLADWRSRNPHVFKGWKSECGHEARTVPATVLDPFSGSGTTGVSANSLGRDFIGIELNPEYVAMSERRLFEPQPSFIDLLRDQCDVQNQQGITE